MASQLLIDTQAVWILWWGDHLDSWVKVIYVNFKYIFLLIQWLENI